MACLFAGLASGFWAAGGVFAGIEFLFPVTCLGAVLVAFFAAGFATFLTLWGFPAFRDAGFAFFAAFFAAFLTVFFAAFLATFFGAFFAGFFVAFFADLAGFFAFFTDFLAGLRTDFLPAFAVLAGLRLAVFAAMDYLRIFPTDRYRTSRQYEKSRLCQ
ncbi:MAG: hypothetical protein IPK87_01115 [Planctomycetes bacterium]|nr:hypothetical protein [Planctomycetota bacterium]